jgi:hypothetical protein
VDRVCREESISSHIQADWLMGDRDDGKIRKLFKHRGLGEIEGGSYNRRYQPLGQSLINHGQSLQTPQSTRRVSPR